MFYRYLVIRFFLEHLNTTVFPCIVSSAPIIMWTHFTKGVADVTVWRAGILSLGLGISILMGILLFAVNGVSTPIVSFFSKEEPQDIPFEDRGISFPIEVDDSALIIDKAMPYTGTYVEDMTCDYVNGVFALAVRNTGSDWISSLDISLYDQTMQYRFFATGIPPGTAVLLLETHRAPYTEIRLNDMDVYIRLSDYPICSSPNISVDAVGLDMLAVTNLTDRIQSDVFVYYKSNYRDESCLLGGITHAERIPVLAPNETLYLQPEFYNGINSTVLYVK